MLREIGPAPHLLVDAANTIGSRPDGWWRDRPGAVRRLRDQLAAAMIDGLDLGETANAGPIRRWPNVTLVTEGAARGVEAVTGVRVVPAAGSGDDLLVALARDQRAEPRPVVVVTADRELRRRVKPSAPVSWARAYYCVNFRLAEDIEGSDSVVVIRRCTRPTTIAKTFR